MRRLRANSPSIDGHHLLARARAGHVHRAQPALDHVEREREVVAHDRVDHHVGVAARRVDRAVAGGDRATAATRARAPPSRSASTAPSWLASRRRRRAARSAPGRRRSRRAGPRTRATSARAASGSHSALASENATISPRAALDRRVLRADLAAARQLEHQVGARLRAPARRCRRRSRRTRRSPRGARAGSRARSAFATFAAITRSSSWAATTSDSDGSGGRVGPPPGGRRRARAAPARASSGEQRARVADLRPDDQARADARSTTSSAVLIGGAIVASSDA